jgi:hypothetical protein
MKKLPAVFCIVLISVTMAACTANQRAKDFGGTITVYISTGEKLVNATWKEADLWYLTRPRRSGEVPETSTFKENSTFGMMNGTVIFIER